MNIEQNIHSAHLRDTSIDILKCIAAIIITNSHMDLLYGKYVVLATGGAIGDALFFFCSGYTLFLGRNSDFFNWYKRRINRIYPTIFAWAFISALLLGIHLDMPEILIKGGEWFVSCIMIYYVPLWFIKRYAINKLRWLFCGVICIIIIWYLAIGIDDISGNNNMYGACYFKWCHYFLFTLLGAIIGLHSSISHIDTHIPQMSFTLIKLIFSILAFYALCWFKHKNGIYDFLQITSLLPLLYICYYFYLLCNTKQAKAIYNHVLIGRIIKFIGGLCLEIYLVQYGLFTDKMNSIFPLNLLITFVIILIAAYLLRCMARIWSQTFKTENYNWKEIIKLY
jgi:hypothetical protein